MTAQEKTEARKNKVLEVATRIFAEKGFQETTISEIAKAAGASEASVYEYFNTKENLLFSIPRQHMKTLQDNLEFHLKMVRGAMNKVHAAVYMQLLYYKENPGFAAVMMLTLKHDRKFINTEAHTKIRDYLKIMDRLIREGIESGEFHSDIDPYYLRASLIGALEHIVTNWLLRGRPKDLMSAFEPLFDVCIKVLQDNSAKPFCPLFMNSNEIKNLQ